MTAAGGLILETNLESYFHERIRDARQSLACMIADEVEFYLYNFSVSFRIQPERLSRWKSRLLCSTIEL